MAKAVGEGSQPTPGEDESHWQDPLALRVIECPHCQRKHLLSVSDLPRYAKCVCKKRFHTAQHIVTDEVTTAHDCYAQWQCANCNRVLLVPRFAVNLPAKCQCGHEYPTAGFAGLRRYLLDEVTDAFVGNDPLLSENMLIPLRAARKYDYEVAGEGDGRFRVRNPTNGSMYTVTLSADFIDDCDCGVFQAGSDTCIHIEHVRIKQGLPSTAQVMAGSQEFAYAWLDKASLPARIRVGCRGSIEPKVHALVQHHGPITCQADLDALQSEIEKAGISFRSLSSAKLALASCASADFNCGLAEKICRHGRGILAEHMPQLHQFQIEGGLFLATAQRGLLLDEMGLGKTVQAIAAAFVLRQIGGINSCLILAPKSVLKHWQSEIERFLSMECSVIEGSRDARAELYNGEAFFKAATLEAFRRDFPDVGQHDLVVVDEVHKARNVKTLSNRVLRTLNSRFLFGLSGTAIESSLDDLYGLLRIIRSPDLESPLEFLASHIVCDNFGKTQYTLHPEFFYLRYADRILRRRKHEIEVDIPAIRIEQVDLLLSELQEEMAQPLLSELEELRERLKERYTLDDFIRHRWLVNRLVELSDSTELISEETASSTKLEWLRQFLNSHCVQENEKVVIFTRWTRSQAIIVRLCNDLGITHVTLNGKHSAGERKNAVRRFTEDRDVLAFVSTDAGGVGVNLQVARTIVNFEPGWNPSTDAQRIQRVHRIGQTREVRAYLPLTTLDHQFVLSTHPRKSFAADRIDAARHMTSGEPVQTWEELMPVIELLRNRAEGAARP